jgi:hypothetical protein
MLLLLSSLFFFVVGCAFCGHLWPPIFGRAPGIAIVLCLELLSSSYIVVVVVVWIWFSEYMMALYASHSIWSYPVIFEIFTDAFSLEAWIFYGSFRMFPLCFFTKDCPQSHIHICSRFLFFLAQQSVLYTVLLATIAISFFCIDWNPRTTHTHLR